jgi:TonB family protein
MGNIQPEKPAVPQTASPQEKQEKSEEENLTQNDEEAPAIEKPKATKPKEEKPVEQPQPAVNQKALFKGGDTPQAGGSEGITGQPGDQGKPNGLAGIKQYEGNGGKGNGPGYSLGGRGAKSLHRPSDDFTEEGTIVVDIWVNREGKVVRAEVATKGTTLINSEMRQRAVQAALRSSFVEAADAPEEQHGTITYTFVIK